jgi:hypothetical protein
MNKKELKQEIKLLKEYKELLEMCLELKERLNNSDKYIPYPNYPSPYTSWDAYT